MRTLRLGGLALALVLVSGVASAYCLRKPSGATAYLKWASSPVTYRVSNNLTDATILAAIDAAFQTWGSQSCSTLKFTKGTPFTMCTQTPCGSGTVPYLHNTANISVFWYTSATGFPSTTTYASYMYLWYDTSGAITGASIAVNAFNYKWNATGGSSTQFILDVQNELTNFIGTVIGLAASSVTTASMYSTMMFGDTSKRVLDPDDVNGLVYLYKVSTCAAPPPPGANGCSGTSVDGGSPKDGGADKKLADSKPPADKSIGDGHASSDGKLDGPSTLDAARDTGKLKDGQSVDGPRADRGRTGEGGPAADGRPDQGSIVPPVEDDGCCRVAPGLARGQGAGALLLLSLWMLARRRRRR